MAFEDTDTQLLDDVDVDQSGQDTTDDSNDDFLVVDDRTKYKTQEDAIKAYQEAGKRISSLSVWEKTAKEFGLTDPKQIRALAAEALAGRKAAEAAKGKPNAEGTGNKTTSDDDAELTPEEKKALDWLKKNAVKAGYVPKDELEALKKQLEGLTNFQKQSSEERFNSLVETGRSQLKTLMTTDKLPVDNEEVMSVIEDAIAQYVNSDEERVNRFYAGGDVTKGLLEEAYKRVSKAFGLVKANATTDYATRKTQVVARNAKPLPRNGAPKNEQGKKEIGITSKTHDAAWEMFQKKIKGSE